MHKTIMLIMVGSRRETAVEVQKLLTEYGCSIKTRLGLHTANENQCSEDGLIVLELVGDEKAHDELYNKLDGLKCLSVKLERMKLENC
jgi:hypothetical protein